MSRGMDRLRLMVQLVTGLVFDSDGNATCKGADDNDDLEPTVGYHFGFYSRPNDGARGMVLKVGGEGNTSVLIAFRDKQYELTLEKGEAGMKNAFDASVLLDRNGNIVATPGGSGKVQLGGSPTPDAAMLGTTFDAAIDAFLTALTTYNSALLTLAAALVPATGVAPGAQAPFATAGGVFAAAINTFKNANYLSQTVALK